MRAPLAALSHALRCIVPFEGLVPVQDIKLFRSSCPLYRLLWEGTEVFIGPLFHEVFGSFEFGGRREDDAGPFRVDLVPGNKHSYDTTFVQKLKLQFYVQSGTFSLRSSSRGNL